MWRKYTRFYISIYIKSYSVATNTNFENWARIITVNILQLSLFSPASLSLDYPKCAPEGDQSLHIVLYAVFSGRFAMLMYVKGTDKFSKLLWPWNAFTWLLRLHFGNIALGMFAYKNIYHVLPKKPQLEFPSAISHRNLGLWEGGLILLIWIPLAHNSRRWWLRTLGTSGQWACGADSLWKALHKCHNVK